MEMEEIGVNLDKVLRLVEEVAEMVDLVVDLIEF